MSIGLVSTRSLSSNSYLIMTTFKQRTSLWGGGLNFSLGHAES